MPRSGQHHGRRALRLLAAIGAVLGALCLVLAAMGLVVELGPHHRRAVTAFRGYSTDPPKKIRLPRRYGIAWSFSCPAGRVGTFSVDAASDGGPGTPKSTMSGQRGQGTWRARRGRPARSLYIVSDCDWRARLIPPPGTSSPEPQPGGNGQKKHHGHGKGHQKHKKLKKKAKKQKHAMKKHAKNMHRKKPHHKKKHSKKPRPGA